MPHQNDPGVREMVRAEFARLSENAQVAERYPGLNDHNSDFFRDTAHALRDIPEGTPGRLRLAAESVELEMRREGTWKEPAPAAEPPSEQDDAPTAQQASLAAEIIGGDRAKAIAAYREQAQRGVNVSLGGRLAGDLNSEE